MNHHRTPKKTNPEVFHQHVFKFLETNYFLRNLQLIRCRINLTLTLPSEAPHLIIPEQCNISFRNENFQLGEGPEKNEERFIIYATTHKPNIFSVSSEVYFESTFKSAPEISSKLVFIHGK
ncbi:hypothetical protein HZS_7321 [Henneguya salminicola]|nr:hypothetical protein HZS_7321 [Henneguya salminicola]